MSHEILISVTNHCSSGVSRRSGAGRSGAGRSGAGRSGAGRSGAGRSGRSTCHNNLIMK